MGALYIPKDSAPMVKVIDSLEKMSLFLTHGIMKFAPIGIFVLMTGVLAKSGFGAIVSLSKYMITVILGLSSHAIILLLIASWKAKKSPVYILRGIGPALVTAFSTASSAATLPITMANVEENLGVRKETAKFVLPLGATINMDGTALYESVAAIFIAQAYGIDLGITQQLIIFLTASLAAIGAAAIPGAGLITMSIVLSAVGLPIEGIGLILAVDRVLDMFRTTVNVFGDSVGTVVVDSMLSSEDVKSES
jgi:Na+/H+-dicarboxylate symporter